MGITDEYLGEAKPKHSMSLECTLWYVRKFYALKSLIVKLATQEKNTNAVELRARR